MLLCVFKYADGVFHKIHFFFACHPGQNLGLVWQTSFPKMQTAHTLRHTLLSFTGYTYVREIWIDQSHLANWTVWTNVIRQFEIQYCVFGQPTRNNYMVHVDEFHFSLSCMELYHHAACWLVNIHITWPFCPPVSMVKIKVLWTYGGVAHNWGALELPMAQYPYHWNKRLWWRYEAT